MGKVTYVSVVKEGLEAGKSNEEILVMLKAALPQMDEKKLKAKLSPTVQYIKGKKTEA